MKKYIFCIIIFLICTLKLMSQNENKGIRYYFCPKIDTILKIAIDSNILNFKNSDSMSYFIFFYDGDTTIDINLETYSKRYSIYDSIGDIIYWIGYIVKNTNRYILIDKQKIPIVFYSDLDFGVIKMIDEKEGAYEKYYWTREFEKRLRIVADKRGAMNFKIYKVSY